MSVYGLSVASGKNTNSVQKMVRTGVDTVNISLYQ